jgi:hypothetical protein
MISSHFGIKETSDSRPMIGDHKNQIIACYESVARDLSVIKELENSNW